MQDLRNSSIESLRYHPYNYCSATLQNQHQVKMLHNLNNPPVNSSHAYYKQYETLFAPSTLSTDDIIHLADKTRETINQNNIFPSLQPINSIAPKYNLDDMTFYQHAPNSFEPNAVVTATSPENFIDAFPITTLDNDQPEITISTNDETIALIKDINQRKNIYSNIFFEKIFTYYVFKNGKMTYSHIFMENVAQQICTDADIELKGLNYDNLLKKVHSFSDRFKRRQNTIELSSVKPTKEQLITLVLSEKPNKNQNTYHFNIIPPHVVKSVIGLYQHDLKWNKRTITSATGSSLPNFSKKDSCGRLIDSIRQKKIPHIILSMDLQIIKTTPPFNENAAINAIKEYLPTWKAATNRRFKV